MINSMTGYGDANGQLAEITYVVEIRTVNNRYFKPKIKLPEAIAFLEEDIENLLRANLSRGTVNYNLRLKNFSSDAFFCIDETALRVYMEKLGRIVSSAYVKCQMDVAGLLALPGMLTPLSRSSNRCVRSKALSLLQI